MPELKVLVDLNNTNVARGVHKPNPNILADRLDTLVRSLSNAITTERPGLWNLHFRLYDGWFDEQGRGSERYEMLRKKVYDLYPTRTRTARHFVSMATALAAQPDIGIPHTLRVIEGLPTRGKISLSVGAPGCAYPSNCSIASLKSWVRGGCSLIPDCRVETTSVASHTIQKLVDTAVVSDTIWYASHGQSVAVVSDDEDVIPGLITARAFGAKVMWISRWPRVRLPYSTAIRQGGVEFITC